MVSDFPFAFPLPKDMGAWASDRINTLLNCMQHLCSTTGSRLEAIDLPAKTQANCIFQALAGPLMTLHNNKKPLQGPCITAQPRTRSPTIKTAWEVPLAANYFSQSRRAAALLTKYSMRYKESPARTAPSLLTLRLPRHGADMAGKAGSIYWGSPHSASPGSAVRTIPARHILG